MSRNLGGLPVRPFEVEEARTDGVWTLVVKGEVDSSNATQLRDAIRRGVGCEQVIIDLRSVPFMDSAGLGALICGIREVRAPGGTATLCVRRGGVKRLIEMTGFERIVPIASSPGEARARMDEDSEQALAAS